MAGGRKTRLPGEGRQVPFEAGFNRRASGRSEPATVSWRASWCSGLMECPLLSRQRNVCKADSGRERSRTRFDIHCSCNHASTRCRQLSGPSTRLLPLAMGARRCRERASGSGLRTRWADPRLLADRSSSCLAVDRGAGAHGPGPPVRRPAGARGASGHRSDAVPGARRALPCWPAAGVRRAVRTVGRDSVARARRGA